MKKKLAIALLGAAVLASLAGCGKAEDGMVTDTPDNKPLPTAIHGSVSPDAPAPSGVVSMAPDTSAMP